MNVARRLFYLMYLTQKKKHFDVLGINKSLWDCWWDLWVCEIVDQICESGVLLVQEGFFEGKLQIMGYNLLY